MMGKAQFWSDTNRQEEAGRVVEDGPNWMPGYSQAEPKVMGKAGLGLNTERLSNGKKRMAFGVTGCLFSLMS